MRGDLVYSPLVSLDDLKGMFCGVKVVDEILHSQVLLAGLAEMRCDAYLVHNEDGALVGFFAINMNRLEFYQDGRYFYHDILDIAYLAVEKSFQRRGIGTAIINKIIELSEEKNPDGVYISVDALCLPDENYWATPFYEKCGFISIDPPKFDTIRMYRKVHQ